MRVALSETLGGVCVWCVVCGVVWCGVVWCPSLAQKDALLRFVGCLASHSGRSTIVTAMAHTGNEGFERKVIGSQPRPPRGIFAASGPLL